MKPVKARYNCETNQFELNTDYSLNCVSTDLACEEHTHEYIELVYCFSGSALNYIDGASYMLCKGDMLLIDKNSTHAFFPKQRTNYCDIMLKPSFFDKNIDERSGIFSLFEIDEFNQFRFAVQKKNLIHFSVEDRKKVEFLIKATADEQREGKIADISMRRSALSMLLTLLFRYMSADEGLKLDGELLDYIKEHCDENLTASDLAQRCFYSLEHFSRKFKRLAGKSFTRYLTETRLDKASDLLIASRKTVDAIMLESGFRSRGEFYKKFEKRFGVTPSEYRKNQKSVHL